MSAFERALSHAKKNKIDECEIIGIKHRTTTIRITDSEIAETKQCIEENYGIRIIHEKKISSAQTIELKELEKCIDTAYGFLPALEPKNFWQMLPQKIRTKSRIDGIFDKKLENITPENAIDIAQRMIDSAKSPKISSISGSLNIVSEEFILKNSHGLDFSDYGTYIAGIINADAENSISGMGHASCRTLEKFVPEDIGNDARQMCIESMNPKKCDAGTYSIIFEPYSVGELLAFVIAANFSQKTVSEKKSCFSNDFDKKIAVESLELVDDPHYPEGIGSKAVDDEGTSTKKLTLVKDGIFKNTFSDWYNAFKDGRNSTGNAKRIGTPMGRSAESIPTHLPHNIKIESGNMSPDDMIKETRHGLLVGRLWYTYAVNPIRGDFSCTARSGIRIIENGEIQNAGSSVRIIHNIAALFQNILGIGNNTKNVMQWASIPSITPSLMVDGIRVQPI